MRQFVLNFPRYAAPKQDRHLCLRQAKIILPIEKKKQDYNLDTMAKRFGLTPEQFGENLRDNYARNDVDQYPADPVELAKEHVDERGSFNT